MPRFNFIKHSVWIIRKDKSRILNVEGLSPNRALAQKDYLLFLKKSKLDKTIGAVEIIEDGCKTGRVYEKAGAGHKKGKQGIA